MKLTTPRARREWLRRAFRGYANLTVIINDVVRKWFGPERTRWKSNTITTVDYFIVTLHTRIYSCVRIFSRSCSTFCIRAICSTLFSLDCFLSLFGLPIFVSLIFSRLFCRLRLCTSGMVPLANSVRYLTHVSILPLLINRSCDCTSHTAPKYALSRTTLDCNFENYAGRRFSSFS